MSFMFNPYPFDDVSAVNQVEITDAASVVEGTRNTAGYLADRILDICSGKNGRIVVGLDGYPTADWLPLIRLVSHELTRRGAAVTQYDVKQLYSSASELERLLEDHLPVDLESDPVSLFGKLYHGDITVLFDERRLNAFRKATTDTSGGGVTFVYGCGCGMESFREMYDLLVYVDVIPKDAVLRIKGGEYQNLGDDRVRTYRETM